MIISYLNIILFYIFLPIFSCLSTSGHYNFFGTSIKFLDNDNFNVKKCHCPTVVDVYDKLQPVVKIYLYEDKKFDHKTKKKFIILISSDSIDTRSNELAIKDHCKGWKVLLGNEIQPSFIEEIECKDLYNNYFPNNALRFGNLYNVYFDIQKKRTCNDNFLMFKNYRYTICISEKIKSICFK